MRSCRSSYDGAEGATTRARRVQGLSLTDLRRGFRDDAQRRRVQNVIHDRLADDREQEECRYLMRLWWQLSMPYSEVTIEELRTRVHGTKWEAVEALIGAIRSSPDQVDAWISATEEAFPIAQDRGFEAAARLDEYEGDGQASGG
jgi:hypothetical protein